MYVDHSHIDNPEKNPALCIYDIFRLQTDPSYSVYHEKLNQQILVYTDEGRGTLIYKNEEFSLEAGHAFMFEPKDTSFFYWTACEKWNFWWFEFHGLPYDLNAQIYHVKEGNIMEWLCEKTRNAHRTENTSAAAAYLSGMLAMIEESVQEEIGTSMMIFLQAQSLMKEKLYHVNISALAQQLGVNTRTLYNLFYRYARCAPKEYLKNCVIERAKYLLKNTTKTVGEISDEMGFSNSFHFSRVFKEETGMTPSMYRKHH